MNYALCSMLMFRLCCSCQALSGVDASLKANNDILQNSALQSVLASQFLFQIGIFTAVPMIVNLILEQGLTKVRMCCLSFHEKIDIVIEKINSVN